MGQARYVMLDGMIVDIVDLYPLIVLATLSFFKSQYVHITASSHYYQNYWQTPVLVWEDLVKGPTNMRSKTKTYFTFEILALYRCFITHAYYYTINKYNILYDLCCKRTSLLKSAL